MQCSTHRKQFYRDSKMQRFKLKGLSPLVLIFACMHGHDIASLRGFLLVQPVTNTAY